MFWHCPRRKSAKLLPSDLGRLPGFFASFPFSSLDRGNRFGKISGRSKDSLQQEGQFCYCVWARFEGSGVGRETVIVAQSDDYPVFKQSQFASTLFSWHQDPLSFRRLELATAMTQGPLDSTTGIYRAMYTDKSSLSLVEGDSL